MHKCQLHTRMHVYIESGLSFSCRERLVIWKERNHTHTLTSLSVNVFVCEAIGKVHFYGVSVVFSRFCCFSFSIRVRVSVCVYVCLCHCTNDGVAIYTRPRPRQRQWGDRTTTASVMNLLWCEVCVFVYPNRSRHETTKIYYKDTEWICVWETNVMDTP